MPFDDLNAEVTSDITWWPWREWYYTINVCNFAISRCGEDNSQLSNKMKRIKGQVLFLRGLSYYNLVGYYQNPPLVTDYATYSSLDGLYTSNSTYDAVLDQIEKDFTRLWNCYLRAIKAVSGPVGAPPAALRQVTMPAPS